MSWVVQHQSRSRGRPIHRWPVRGGDRYVGDSERPVSDVERDTTKVPIRRTSYPSSRPASQATNRSRALIRRLNSEKMYSDGRTYIVRPVPPDFWNTSKTHDKVTFGEVLSKPTTRLDASISKLYDPWNSFIDQLDSQKIDTEILEPDEDKSEADIAKAFLKKYTTFHEAPVSTVAASTNAIGISVEYSLPSRARGAGIKGASTASGLRLDRQRDELYSSSSAMEVSLGINAEPKTIQKSVTCPANERSMSKPKLEVPKAPPMANKSANGKVEAVLLSDIFEEPSNAEDSKGSKGRVTSGLSIEAVGDDHPRIQAGNPKTHVDEDRAAMSGPEFSHLDDRRALDERLLGDYYNSKDDVSRHGIEPDEESESFDKKRISRKATVEDFE